MGIELKKFFKFENFSTGGGSPAHWEWCWGWEGGRTDSPSLFSIPIRHVSWGFAIPVRRWSGAGSKCDGQSWHLAMLSCEMPSTPSTFICVRINKRWPKSGSATVWPTMWLSASSGAGWREKQFREVGNHFSLLSYCLSHKERIRLWPFSDLIWWQKCNLKADTGMLRFVMWKILLQLSRYLSDSHSF